MPRRENINVDSDHDEQQQEELVYVGAQILAGNLDKELATLGSIGADELKKQSQDLSERRGRAVLGVFNSGEYDENDSKFSNEEDHDWAERATTFLSSHDNPFSTLSGNRIRKNQGMWKILRQPIVSVAHVCIANGLVDRALHIDEVKLQASLYGSARRHLCAALHLWMCNPSALLALANLTRMGVVDAPASIPPKKRDNPDNLVVHRRMQQAMRQYIAAAKCAASVRLYGIEKLIGSNKLQSADDSFLVETIVLGLVAQVDALEDNDDDGKNKNVEKSSLEEQYGQSKVVSTASYMAALLASTLGHHHLAKEALAAFGQNVTRIHPAVWDTAATLTQKDIASIVPSNKALQSASFATAGAFTPSIFQDAVPEEMARTLRYAFRPDAPYWDQSGYDRGVYYSFWHDFHRPTEGKDPTIVVSNAVEDVIASYLLPRVRAVVGEDKLSELAGFEWWVHTRPHGANLGHQLHFDTDEALLEQDQIVSFPICATVLYLNGKDESNDSNQHFGATVLFDQTPYCKKNAERAWISTPRARSFLVFPGDLLHGVLPCAPSIMENDKEIVKDTMPQNKRKRKSTAETDISPIALPRIPPEHTPEQPHRLTFMVNFWARNIPERLKKRKLYGPSGPFPPTTRRHSWTNDLLDGSAYPRCIRLPNMELETISTMGALVCAEPAWELLNDDEGSKGKENEKSADRKTFVDLPRSGINQRFFVKNAPDFFHSTLFEK